MRERGRAERERERLEYIEEGVSTVEDYGLDVICCLRVQTSVKRSASCRVYIYIVCIA